MTRTGIVLGCLAWLLVVSLPAAALVLFATGEIAWRRGPLGLETDRLFLVREPAYAGLALETTRLNDTNAAAVCATTTMTYWLWRNAEDANPNITYCQCFDRLGAPLDACP